MAISHDCSMRLRPYVRRNKTDAADHQVLFVVINVKPQSHIRSSPQLLRTDLIEVTGVLLSHVLFD